MKRGLGLLVLAALVLQGHTPNHQVLVRHVGQGQTPSEVLGDLWLADSFGVTRIDSATSAVNGQIAFPNDVRAVAVDAAQGRVWALSDGIATAMEVDGTLLYNVPTGASSTSSSYMAIHDADGVVWIGVGKDLYKISGNSVLVATSLPDSLTGLSLDRVSELIWVGQKKSAIAFDHETGAQVVSATINFSANVQDLAVDSTGSLWIATSAGLVRGADSGGALVSSAKFDVLGTDHNGGVWAADGATITAFSAAGTAEWTSILFEGIGKVEDVAFDQVGGNGWVANQTSLAEVRPDGSLVRYLVLSPTTRIWDLDMGVDRIAPTIEFVSPETGEAFNYGSLDLKVSFEDAGSGVDSDSLAFAVDGSPVETDCAVADVDATCSLVDSLTEGEYVIEATITDRGGNLSEPATVTVGVDLTAPQLTVIAPEDGLITNEPAALALSGSISEPGTIELNGASVTVATDLSFAHAPLNLVEGTNVLNLLATDLAGNETSLQVTVIVDTIPPAAVNEALVTVSSVGSTAAISGAPGAAEAGATIRATNTRSGESSAATVAGDGAFSLSLAAVTGDLANLVAVDRAGNVSPAVTVAVSSSVTWSCNSPPDPASIAPPVDTTVSYDMFEANRFLWEGVPPVQVGVTQGTITSDRIILVRGRVLDAAGEALAGVRVTVKDHPEFGCTSTRMDGQFDLAANGGGPVIIRFQQDGYFPVDRREETFWRQYYHLDDVVMTEVPPESHQVALGQPTAQFFSAPTVTDADGSRATAFLVPAGTQASLRMSDGSTQPVSSLSVRVQEYTVGEGGPLAMPAALPPSSGYTYAFEATADEALAVGAVSVDFSQPLFHYVENFLDFPVGEYVPTGYYDRQAGAWVASGNGIVVQVLSVDGAGQAVLDFDGDGVAEDAAFLLDNEVSNGELSLVATRYAVGQTLWRVPIPHFTPWDCNWPYGPPEDAEPPPDDAVDQESDPDNNDCETGSIIDCQSQNLRESIPVAGTPYSLHYNSALTAGKKSSRRINIRLLGEVVPASAEHVQVKVEVAGQTTVAKYPISVAPPEWSFEWDGLDAHGRPVVGETLARIEIGYGYPAVYRSAWSGASAGSGGGGGPPGSRVSSLLSFGRPSSTLDIVGSRDDSFRIVVRRTFQKRLRNFDARFFGLGGWMLDQQLFLDRDTHGLITAGGVLRSSTDISTPGVLLVEEGSQDVLHWQDGDWAVVDDYVAPSEIETTAAGELIFAHLREVFRRDHSGEIYRIAGGGIPPFQNGRWVWEDEGKLAVEARFVQLGALQAAADGTLYIADWQGSRILRIDSSARIYAVAGNGDSQDYSGDEGLATQAGIGEPIGLTLGPDDALYVAHTRPLPSGAGGGWSLVFRRIDLQTGIITTFAGSGMQACWDPGPTLDGQIALDACIGFQLTGRYPYSTAGASPTDIAFDKDGGLLFPQSKGFVYPTESYIWRIGPSGVLERFAGAGPSGHSGDGGPATEAQLNRLVGVELMGDSVLIVPYSQLRYPFCCTESPVREVRRDGTITTVFDDYVDAVRVDGSGESYSWRHNRPTELRVIGSARGYPLAADEIKAPSVDGEKLYTFDHSGRILQTQDTLTGVTITQLSYDSGGQLAAVADRDGDSMTVVRSGSSIALVAPDGARTTLVLDANGSTSLISNSAGEVWNFSYNPEGLLTSMKKPEGGKWQFEYDEDGRLIRSTDPAGGFKQLVRAQDGRPYTVGVTTAEGRTTSYGVVPYGDGTELRTTTTGDLVEELALLKQAAGAVELPDGTFVNVETSPDPRFGTASPYASRVTVDTPGGRVREVTTSRSAIRLGGDLVETVAVNGRLLTSRYDQPSNSITTTTPEGRVVIIQLNELGRVGSMEVGGLAPIEFTYNEQGKFSSVFSTADGITRLANLGYGSDGWLVSATDPLGRTTTWDRDPVGRAISQSLPDGRSIGFGYDANGNPTSLTPPGRPAHSFSYSQVDQATGYDPPGSPAVSYSYDLDRRLTRIDFASGGAVDLTHDTENRLLSVDTNDDDLTLTYVPGTTHVASISRSNGQTNAYTYDGFLPLSQSWSGVVSGNVSYDYDADFRIDSLSINGTVIAYGYDGDSLVTQAGDLSASRDPANGLLSGTVLDTISTTWGYNGFGEPTAYEATDGTSTLFREEMDRDLLGRVTQKRETFGTTTTVFDYGYDETGRLVWVDMNGSRAVTWTYDANDNRLSEVDSSTTNSGTYDDQDRLLSYGSSTYAWNHDGDLAARTTNTFIEAFDYDVFGNLITYSSPSVDVEYVIDGQNRRVGKRINGTLVQGFLYADQLNPVAELDGSGTVISTFVYGTRPNTPDYMVKGVSTYRIISDHLGSVRLVVNAADGSLAQRMDYDAWGKVVYDSNPGFQPFGFAGGIYDRHTGLTRFGARDYDPQTSRWTAKDPILFAGGDTNLYGYVNNSPTSWTDPSGLGGFCFRPLDRGDAPWAGSLSAEPGSLVDAANLFLAHEEYLFDPVMDEEGNVIQESVGFNPALDAPGGWRNVFRDKPGAIQADDPANHGDYRACRTETYDDAIMERVVEELEADARWNTYNLYENNCQDFAGAMRQKYWEIAVREALNVAFGDNAAGSSLGQ